MAQAKVPGLPPVPSDASPAVKAWMNAVNQVLNGLDLAGSSPSATADATASKWPAAGIILATTWSAEDQEECLYCDGRPLRVTQWSRLYQKIGTKWGDGTKMADGTTSSGYAAGEAFNLPIGKGRFLRGVDDGAGVDPDAASRAAANVGGNSGDDVGTLQTDAGQGHFHQTWYMSGGGAEVILSGASNGTALSGATTEVQARTMTDDTVHGTPRISSETRSINAGVRFFITT
jgi:rhizosphere induced protein